MGGLVQHCLLCALEPLSAGFFEKRSHDFMLDKYISI